MASPWSHQSLIHCFSVAAKKRTCSIQIYLETEAGAPGWIAIKKTCRVSVHFSHKPLRTLTQHPVALTPNLWQLATPERCENYGSWFRPRHERQAQSGVSGWIVIVKACHVHFPDKALRTLSQCPVALTATLCNGFALMASPWSHQSLIHCFSVAAKKRTCWLLCSNLLGGWSQGSRVNCYQENVPCECAFFWVALTPNLWQLATPERCENYGSWFQPRHERQAQGEASAIWGFSVPVHFSDKPLSTLSQRPVALTATGFALSHWFTALPWQQGGEDVNRSIEIWRRISGLRGEARLHLAKDKACNSEQERCLRCIRMYQARLWQGPRRTKYFHNFPCKDGWKIDVSAVLTAPSVL